MTHRVPIYGSGPHRYLRPDPWDPIKVAGPTHGAGTLRPTTRPAGSVCSLVSLPTYHPHLDLALCTLIQCSSYYGLPSSLCCKSNSANDIQYMNVIIIYLQGIASSQT
jgi:hypothetical protein